MEDKELKIVVSKRLANARSLLLLKNPFYGALVMRMDIKLARCQTAATDMENIYFDPVFAERLSDDELEFIFMHEVLHCVLKHCIRRGDRNSQMYNIACDIVVNSNILHSLGESEFRVDGEEVIHVAPDGKEGYLYSAEEVYEMLMNKYGSRIVGLEMAGESTQEYGGNLDDHDVWGTVAPDSSLADQWENILIEAASKTSGDGGAPGLSRMLDAIRKKAGINWREILHDFIQLTNDNYDFTFIPRDRRFDGDFIIPAFNEIETWSVENIWFVVDTSGSVPDDRLAQVFDEICSAVEQFDSLEGKLSFFDSQVSPPVAFDSIASLKQITPVGGGGTSFKEIFKQLPEYFRDKPPACVVILTDGYAEYPSQAMARGVPVLWIIFNNDKMAPWGTSVRLE